MHGLLRDIRHALRIFLSTPTVTVAAVLTLALGIGANIAMFSIVYGVLLRPLPYQDADRLALARAEVDYSGANSPVRLSVPWIELKTASGRTLDGITALAFYTASDVVALSGDAGSEVLDSAIVSHSFFSTMAGPLAAGRQIDVADGNEPVVVISARLARRLFREPDHAIGKTLPLSRGTFTVIGVADRAFQFPSADVDVWMSTGPVNVDRTFFHLITRLEPDGTLERARAALQPMLQESAAARGRKPEEIRTTVVRLSDEMVATVRPALLILFASVLMVLLTACGNLINLLLARITAREQEFAVRRALGASAGRLVRQLLVESALLAVAGVAGGIVVARLSLVALPRLAGEAVPRIDAVQLDRPALLFAVGLAVLVTFVTGITPALRAARTAAIAHRGASGTATPGARRLQRSMCIVQVALAVMLLVGATLMGRSLARLLDVDLGVTTDHVLTASLTLAFGKRPPDAETIARIERVIEHVRTLPGVRAVGAGTSLPPSRSRMRLSLRRTGDAADYQAAAVPATPGYFSALQMRLLNGRFFTEADDDQHPQAVILSENTAKRFFGAGDPIGRTMTLPVLKNGARANVEVTVVGVTANVKYAGLADPPDDVVYRPFKQQPWVAPFLVVRTAGDPADFAPTLQRRIAAVDKGIVVASVATLDQLVVDETTQPRFRAVLLASLATLALVIAAMGLYGVVAYAVSRRTKEIGIRIALGATSREVLAMVLRDGLIIAIGGIVVGTAGASMLTQALAGLLYGITPTDPMSFIVAAAGLLGLTLVATYFPARRAARIQPVQALRTE